MREINMAAHKSAFGLRLLVKDWERLCGAIRNVSAIACHCPVTAETACLIHNVLQMFLENSLFICSPLVRFLVSSSNHHCTVHFSRRYDKLVLGLSSSE